MVCSDFKMFPISENVYVEVCLRKEQSFLDGLKGPRSVGLVVNSTRLIHQVKKNESPNTDVLMRLLSD